MITLDKIAELAAVSPATVSRVINHHPNVRPAVRARVQAVIEQHGYTPNAAARSLATRRTNIVGFLVSSDNTTHLYDPMNFYGVLTQSVAAACSNRGRYLMLSVIRPGQEQDFYRDVLGGGHLDGLIVGYNRIDDPLLPRLIAGRTPVVFIGNNPYFPDVHRVDVDNFQSAVAAVEHLAAAPASPRSPWTRAAGARWTDRTATSAPYSRTTCRSTRA
jgi:LacI family transcriptional regulator